MSTAAPTAEPTAEPTTGTPTTASPTACASYPLTYENAIITTAILCTFGPWFLVFFINWLVAVATGTYVGINWGAKMSGKTVFERFYDTMSCGGRLRC